MISFSEIYFRKKSPPSRLARKIQHVGQWVRVGNGDQVEAAEISAGLPRPVRLPHHVERRRPGAVRPADYPVFLQLSFSASRRRKRAAMGGPVILIWCSTSDPTGGRTFDAQTTSANSSKNSFTHCGDSSGGALAAPATSALAADGGEILLSTWVASAAAAAPARAAESGEILLSTWAASAA